MVQIILPLIWKFNSCRTHEKFENYIIAQANWTETNTYTIHPIHLWSVSHPISFKKRLDFLLSDTISCYFIVVFIWNKNNLMIGVVGRKKSAIASNCFYFCLISHGTSEQLLPVVCIYVNIYMVCCTPVPVYIKQKLTRRRFTNTSNSNTNGNHYNNVHQTMSVLQSLYLFRFYTHVNVLLSFYSVVLLIVLIPFSVRKTPWESEERPNVVWYVTIQLF